MKKSRYTEEQVAYALRLAESGMPVADVRRQAGIAEATFFLTVIDQYVSGNVRPGMIQDLICSSGL